MVRYGRSNTRPHFSRNDFFAFPLQLLRLLGGVWMIGARVDLQFLNHLIGEFVLGQHATNRVIDQILWFAFLAIAIAFQPQPGVAGVPGVVPVIHLLARHADFFGVDDDHEITAIDVGCVLRAMLAHQDHGDVACQTAKDLVAGIDDVPLLFNLAWLGHEAWLSHHGIDLWFVGFEIKEWVPDELWGIEKFIGGCCCGQGLSR